jgi:hypothetical protein
MADLTVTATSVVTVSGGSYTTGTAGATITAGQTLYVDTADSNKLKLADSDSATSTVRTCCGIALNGGAAGQPIRYQTGGSLNPGATLAVGQVYVLSDTAGGIMPYADLEAGDYVFILGYATTTSNLTLALTEVGVALLA